MRPNDDSRLRALERQAESGTDSDILAFVQELVRAGRLEDSDLRPSMQARVLDTLARQARAGSRGDILLYMKALDSISGYPLSKVPGPHISDAGAAIAVALLGRGADPEAVYRVMSQTDEVWENDIGPMLDELERECEVAETEIERGGDVAVAAAGVACQQAAWRLGERLPRNKRTS